MLHTDRFRPSLCVWQVLGITNQFKTAHETQVIHNETPNQDYKARLSLLSRNERDGEAAGDGDERRVGRRQEEASATALASGISLSRGSAPRIAHVVFLFQKAFSSPVTVEGGEVWSVVTAGCPWLHHIFVFLLKKQPQI